jgi:hypothetical protein
MRWRFYRSGLYISPLAPFLLGFGAGMLTVLLGVGGGFIVVPAMIYLLGMSAQVVVGTSLLQILFVTAATTLIHATTTKSVDIVLAGLLLLGSVIGAQFGARLSQKVKPELLRMFLAIIVLAVAVRMAIGLGWRPEEIYTCRCCEPGPRPSPPVRGAARARRRQAAAGAGRVAERVEIRYSFTGAELLLFGAILYPGGRVLRPSMPTSPSS